MGYEIYDLATAPAWTLALAELPEDQQDIYFTPEYYALYEKHGYGQASCFVFRDRKGIALYPFLINPVNSVTSYPLAEVYSDIQGAYGYNGVVTSNVEGSFIEDFFADFEAWCKTKKIIAEFTRFHPLLQNHRFSEGHVATHQDRKTIHLDLTQGYSHIWEKEYSSINRNMLRKARKSRLACVMGSSKEDYEEFFQLYSKTMRQVKADQYYFFSSAFFESFRQCLGSNQQMIKVQHDGQTLCAVLIMKRGRYAHYHLSGLERSPWPANNLALDAAVHWAIEQGCARFHLGGGRTNAYDDPLFRFKSNFPKSQADFVIGKKIHDPDVYQQVVQPWEATHPQEKDRLNNVLLKYREP